MGLDEGGGVFGWRGMREEGGDGMEEVGRCGKRLRREGAGGGRRREGRRGQFCSREEGEGKEEVAVWENKQEVVV